MDRIRNWKPAILLLLLAAGLIAGQAGLIDWQWLFLQAQRAAGQWWLAPALILTMAGLFVLGMPGSLFFWISGFFFRPVAATVLIVGGGVLGGVLAYLLAARLVDSPADKAAESPMFRFLQRNSDFFTLAAVRALPFFPHSVINYGAGALGIPLSRFAAASALGFAAKGFIYASAIHGAAEIRDLADLGEAGLVYPLLVLAGLLLVGRILFRRWVERGGSDPRR